MRPAGFRVVVNPSPKDPGQSATWNPLEVKLEIHHPVLTRCWAMPDDAQLQTAPLTAVRSLGSLKIRSHA